MTVWELLSTKSKLALIQFQWNHYHTKLDSFIESQKPVIDHIPEEKHLDKFMAERPNRPAQFV